MHRSSRVPTGTPSPEALTPPAPPARRGVAMIMTLMLTVALGALAVSAIYLASSTRLVAGLTSRAADLQYAADAALQMGRSYLNADPRAMPLSGFREMTFDGGVLRDAAGSPVPNVTVRLWAGPTGATSGQFGQFGSLVAEARDNTGGRVVRRLELAQENFARYAYWSNRETNNGGLIYFGGGDVIFGPAWSNDTVHIMDRGSLPWAVQFRDNFGTARSVLSPEMGDFWKGYLEQQKPITLPTSTSLANLATYATSGLMNFTTGSSGDETTVRSRIEFVNIDIDGDGSATDPQDGFMRIYDLTATASPRWVSGDVDLDDNTSTLRSSLCGEWINVNGTERFFTVASHTNNTIRNWLNTQVPNAQGTTPLGTLMGFQNGGTLSAAQIQTILTRDGSLRAGNRSQCYLGGAPELNMGTAAPWGGTPTSFRVSDGNGAWRLYTGVVDPRVLAARPAEAAYLIPLHRSLNTGSRGVIFVNGTVGVSGTLVGRVTLRSTGTIVVLDDIRYGTNPATSGTCVDVLGLVADKDVVVADNMLNDQVDATVGWGTTNRILDDTKDLTLHSVIMALGTSFRVEGFDRGPTTGNPCQGVERGRGCLALLGGLIQEARGAVGRSDGTGFTKQYSYDRCANLRPPPYFPTTGRFLENRYMEIDPVNFDISALFARLTPAP